MGREIKFRCWDKNKKAMFYPAGLSLEVISFCDNPFNCSNIPAQAQGLVFLQSTSLFDKNGVEVFEGDIIAPFDSQPVNSVVEWYEAKARFHLRPFGRSLDRPLEVIGNIFQHPDLLIDNKDNGGSAFPTQQNETQDGKWNQTYESGMSLRDWFAGQALGGLLNHHMLGEEWRKEVAKSCYLFADAMLAERTKEARKRIR